MTDLTALKSQLEAAADSGDDAATATAMSNWIAGVRASTPDQVEAVLPGFKAEVARRAGTSIR